MASLQEILEKDLGLVEEKTASVAASAVTEEDDEISKLAAELGLTGETEKVAEEKEEEKEDEKEEKEEEKKGSAGMAGGLFASFFPEDADLTEVKTAEEKQAEDYQEAMGARAFDHFATRFDARVEKIASDVLTGAATISSPKASMSGDKGTQDSQVGQQLPNNKNGAPMNVKNTVVLDEMKGKQEAKTVGQVEQQKIAMAVRKHMLKSQLEG